MQVGCPIAVQELSVASEATSKHKINASFFIFVLLLSCRKIEVPEFLYEPQGAKCSTEVADLLGLARVTAHARGHSARQDQAQKQYEEKLFHDDLLSG